MVLVLGDAHAGNPTNRRALLAAYEAAGADVALQTGDLGFYDLPVPTYFIAGNNEDLDVIDALRHGRLSSDGVTNAHLLHSTAAEVAGVSVGGLSGNFAPTRFEYDRAELAGERRRHFVREDVERATALDVDVFLAHEAPHGLPVSEDYEVGCPHVDELLRAIEPALCLVGHHHEHAESTFGDTRVLSLAPVWDSYYTLDPETLAVERHPAPDPGADGQR